MAIGRKLMWMTLGTAASKVVRKKTRNALHNQWGNPRLPHTVRRKRGMGSALAWAVGTGVVMALADVLSEQGKTAARAR